MEPESNQPPFAGQAEKETFLARIIVHLLKTHPDFIKAALIPEQALTQNLGVTLNFQPLPSGLLLTLETCPNAPISESKHVQ